MTPYNLRTEYLVDPIGLDVPQLRLYWKLASDKPGAAQSAYRIRVSSSPDGEPDLWDSGRVASDETIHIRYEGKPLPSMTRAYWRVEVWDEVGHSRVSDEAFWETGIAQTEWGAQWIGGDIPGGKHSTGPVAQLVTGFAVNGVARRARLYITALGLYEAYINGKRVGQEVFAPGWTDYRKRVYYQAYDVTDLLREDDNTFGILLGDGWYCGNVGMDGRLMYGDLPKALARLVIEQEDGSQEVVTTGPDWLFAYGPFIESDLLMGETYDARRELKNWHTVGHELGEFRKVVVYPDPGILVESTRHPLVRVIQELKPVAEPVVLGGWPGARVIYDMGQNMVGRYRIKVRGRAGETMRIRSAEVLTKEGTLYTESLRTARATDYYTFAQDGEVEYEPTFTFHGFRYVEISGLAEAPGPDAVTGVVLGSAMQPTGTFECSDPLVNQLQSNITWGQRGNLIEVPTDCPQRDERLGWTGDAQVFVRTACHNMDVASFFTKWLQDAADAQTDKGEIPPVIPNPSKFGSDGGPAWADAAVICPWTIYQCYADKGILAEHYDTYKRFVDFLDKTAKDGIRVYEGYEGFRGFGDWLSTNADTPPDLIGTAFLAYSSRLLSKIAGVLGQTEDSAHYEALSAATKQAFQKRYVTAAGLVAAHTQTAYVLALQFDLLEEGQKAEAAQALVNDIGRRGWHLSTGFVGTPYIQHVLTKAGRADVAYQLLFQKSWPSWLYPVTKGATTVWERWDGWTEEKGFQTPDMNSFNHYAYGAVGDWLYTTVAGLDVDETRPGYRHINFHPTPGVGLTSAKATLDTIRGAASAGWTIADGVFRYEVLVPPGCTGSVKLPDGEHIGVASGRHVFEQPFLAASEALTVPNSNANAPE